jgi:hypothetical protein
MKTFKTIAIVFAMVLCGTTLLRAQTAAPATHDAKETKKQVEAYLKETRQNLLAQIKGLTPEQFKFKPGPDRWSIAEVCEHIVTSEGMLRGMVEGMLKAPANPEKRAEIKMNFDMIKGGVTNREEPNRRKTMDALVPSGKFATVADAVKAIKEMRHATDEFVEHTSATDMENHVGPVGPLGMLDCYGGVMFIAAHSARHTKQIEENKAAAGYPKGK